jgi:general secretion pathway protein F
MAGDRQGDLGRRPITIEQLIALNDEIIALTRAGVSLESGLLAVGADLPGRLRSITTTLGERMSRGESLSEALERSGADLPMVYRAVVEAGIRSGRLSNALEGLALYARGFAEARRSIILALWYPLTVLVLAYVLFLGILTRVIPRFIQTFDSMGLPVNRALRLLEILSENAWLWGPLIPIGLALILVAGAISGRATALGGSFAHTLMRSFPWTGSMLRGYEAAGYADLLALLLDHRVPYPQALVLAGDASGDPALATSSRAIAADIERGLQPAKALEGKRAFPPLLRLMISAGHLQANLSRGLRQLAERYRAKSRYQADAMRVLLPTILLFGIGATATLFYGLALFVPLTTLWADLATQAP